MPPKTPPLFTPCPLTASAAALCFPPIAALVLHFNRICISTLRYSLECKNPQTTNRKKVALKKLQLQMHLLWDVICSHYASKTKYENWPEFLDWILLQPTHSRASHYTFLQSRSVELGIFLMHKIQTMKPYFVCFSFQPYWLITKQAALLLNGKIASTRII